MQNRALLEKSILPTEVILEDILKDSYAYYKSLVKIVERFDNKWVFYKGWSQKFFDKKKALFYIAPQDGSFVVSMAIREVEKEELIMNSIVSFAHEQLHEAERYNEGYALKFIVDDNKSSEECNMFILELIKVRN